MSDFIIPADKIDIAANDGALGLYQFGSKIAKHYFCKTCGIYPFHETLRKPGHYRINLGCIDEIDTNTLDIEIIDGAGL